MGVFEADEAGQSRMGIFTITDSARNRRQRHFASVSIGHGVVGYTTKHRCATSFVVVDVTFVADDDFVAPSTMRQHPTKIPHSTAGDEQRGFFAYFGGREFFEGIDRRIVTVDIITEGCIKNRLAHGW
jgi:hypothetical protein